MQAVAFIFTLLLLTNCGSEAVNDDSATTEIVSYSSINPIVIKSCGTSRCHGSGASQIVFEDYASNFIVQRANIIERVQIEPDDPNEDKREKRMPKEGTLTEDDKNLMLLYLDQNR